MWLSYGISIALSTAIIVYALVVMVANNAAFSNDFSTIVRVAKRAPLSVLVDYEDGQGVDPLPKYLETAQLDIADVGFGTKEAL